MEDNSCLHVPSSLLLQFSNLHNSQIRRLANSQSPLQKLLVRSRLIRIGSFKKLLKMPLTGDLPHSIWSVSSEIRNLDPMIRSEALIAAKPGRFMSYMD